MKSKGSRGEIIGGTVALHYESGTSVSPGYTAHGSTFNGKINRVQIDLGKSAKDADHYLDKDERLCVIMGENAFVGLGLTHAADRSADNSTDARPGLAGGRPRKRTESMIECPNMMG